MKEFMSFIRKEFRHIFRDKRTILIVLVMPVVQIVLFGFAISTEVHNARVDIVGDMEDPQVRRIVERIDRNAYLTVVGIMLLFLKYRNVSAVGSLMWLFALNRTLMRG